MEFEGRKSSCPSSCVTKVNRVTRPNRRFQKYRKNLRARHWTAGQQIQTVMGQEDQAKEQTRKGLDFYLGSLEQAVG